MRRWRYPGAGLLLLAIIAIVILAAALREAPPARASQIQLYLDYQAPGGKVTDATVPPDCSTWHELYPNYCINHHQDSYEDGDGGGTITPCDFITLDGLRYHIVWVGPTYFLNCGGEERVMDPQDPTGQDPTCETWHEIFPDFCLTHHVDGWGDNGDGVVSPCDIVIIDGVECHIVEIGLDIIIEPEPTSTQESTWGRVKTLFRDLF